MKASVGVDRWLEQCGSSLGVALYPSVNWIRSFCVVVVLKFQVSEERVQKDYNYLSSAAPQPRFQQIIVKARLKSSPVSRGGETDFC